MELEPLATFTATLGRTELVVATPRGRRVVGPIVSSRIEGDRIQATQVGTSAADWMLMGDDGTVYIDVRLAYKCDDGARFFMSYTGRADWSAGMMSGPTFSTPVFETGDPAYAWLNSVLCVGRGEVFDGGARYELAVLR